MLKVQSVPIKFLRMRERGILIALFIGGCAHAPPPPPPPPPPPKGDLLRFKYQPFGETTAKVKLLIETELAARQGQKSGVMKPLALSFTFAVEEEVDEVDPAGGARLTARLADAAGEASASANQQMVDEMALAFDELHIQLKRSGRGEVGSLTLSGLRKPLEEGTARAVLNAVYGAQRGPLFPEGRIEPGATWKSSVALPEASGFHGKVDYQYTLRGKEGDVAVIGCEGVADGQSAGGGASQHLRGRSTAEYRFDVAAGRLRSSTVDQTTQIEQLTQQATQSGVRQHLRVQWNLDDRPPPKKEKAKNE
jgi:hypothetical protein